MGSGPLDTPSRYAAVLARLIVGAAFAWWVAVGIVAPELPLIARLGAIAIFALSLWQPAPGLLLTAGLAPAGVLFAPPPARGAELFAWAFLAGWMLAVWRPLSGSLWPRAAVTPALLYGAVLVASWLALVLGDAAGVAPLNVPSFLLQSIPSDHLIFSSPEPETWTMLQHVTGIALFFAAISAALSDRRFVHGLAWVLVISAAFLALATVAHIVRQWADAGYGSWFLLRYVNGERESLHFTDMNAAGSLYVLAALTAAMLGAFDRPRRWMWITLLGAMLPALWLAGSLSAVMAALIVMGILAAAFGSAQWRPTRAQLSVAAILVVVAMTASALLAAQRGDGRATMSRALQLRSQFTETSARMFAASPVFGVGVGRYFDESATFMPDDLREMYGNENAHNYFAQVFAELGTVGGLLFLWLVVAAVRRAWRHLRSSPMGDGALLGLFAGVAAYLITCLTGHPLLVVGAALPFWTALGVVAAVPAASHPAAAPVWTRWVAPVVGVLLAAQVGSSLAAALQAETPPPERGFHGFEEDEGWRFRYMTRHAVTYVPGDPGFMALRLRAPANMPQTRPLVVEIAIAGQTVATETLPPDAWTLVQIGVRGEAGAPFRRVDLRANQEWTQEVTLGIRRAERPISAMVTEIDWTPVSSVP